MEIEQGDAGGERDLELLFHIMGKIGTNLMLTSSEVEGIRLEWKMQGSFAGYSGFPFEYIKRDGPVPFFGPWAPSFRLSSDIDFDSEPGAPP